MTIYLSPQPSEVIWPVPPKKGRKQQLLSICAVLSVRIAQTDKRSCFSHTWKIAALSLLDQYDTIYPCPLCRLVRIDVVSFCTLWPFRVVVVSFYSHIFERENKQRISNCPNLNLYRWHVIECVTIKVTMHSGTGTMNAGKAIIIPQ